MFNRLEFADYEKRFDLFETFDITLLFEHSEDFENELLLSDILDIFPESILFEIYLFLDFDELVSKPFERIILYF